MARLEVTVVEATNLLQENKSKKNNSFARIYLGNEKGRTRTIENSNDPQWKEVFHFDNLKKQDVLYVIIYTEDDSKNKIIGCIQIKLNQIFKKGRIDGWYHIPAREGLACYGQVHLILEYRRGEA